MNGMKKIPLLKKTKPVIFDVMDNADIELKSEKFVKSIVKSIKGFTPSCPVNTITKRVNKGELWYILRAGESLSQDIETIVEMYYFDKIIFTGRGKILKINNAKTTFQMKLTGLKKNTNPLYFKNFKSCDDCTVILKKNKVRTLDNKEIQTFIISGMNDLSSIITEFITNHYNSNKEEIENKLLNKDIEDKLKSMVDNNQKIKKNTRQLIKEKLLLKYDERILNNDNVFIKNMISDIRCLMYYKCNIDNQIKLVNNYINLDKDTKKTLIKLLKVQKKMLEHGQTQVLVNLRNKLLENV